MSLSGELSDTSDLSSVHRHMLTLHGRARWYPQLLAQIRAQQAAESTARDAKNVALGELQPQHANGIEAH